MMFRLLALLVLLSAADARAQGAEDLKGELRKRESEIRWLRERVDHLEKAAKAAAEPARPEDEEAFDRALERTLVQQGALVLPGWTYELQPHVSYAHWDKSRSVIRREAEVGLSFRAGLGLRSQVELSVPYRRVETSSASATGTGNGELVLSAQLAREGGAWPGLIGALSWTARTRHDGLDGELPTGFGFDVLQAGFTAVKTRDPLVFYAGASYAVPDSREISGTKVQPGEVLGVRFGSALAASPHTSVNLGLNLGFMRRTRLNDVDVPDSDTVLGTFQVGFGMVLSRRAMLNLSGDFRVTGDVPDFRLTASLPIRF